MGDGAGGSPLPLGLMQLVLMDIFRGLEAVVEGVLLTFCSPWGKGERGRVLNFALLLGFLCVE